MERTPARSCSSLTAHKTPSVLQSTPISQLWTPESGYCSSGGCRTSTSYGFSSSPSLFNREDACDCSPGLSSCSGHSMPRPLPAEDSRPRIDFLSDLKSQRPVVCKVLGYLTPRDLAVVCRTSSAWRQLCHSIPEEAQRWKQYIKKRRDIWESSRENFPCSKQAKKQPTSSLPLSESNGNTDGPNPAAQGDGAVGTRSRHDIYAQEAKTLKEGEWHLPCPICNYPSCVTAAGTVAKCKSLECSYQFCPKCHRDSHLPKPCKTLSVPTNPRTKKHLVICSNYSKRQLRRL